MSKYFAISFSSHAALLALLFSASGAADRGKTQHYDQNNVVIDTTPIIWGTVIPENAASRKATLHLRETTLSSTQDDEHKLNSSLSVTNQNLKIYPYDQKSPVIDTSEDNKGSPQPKPNLRNSDSPPREKFIAIKTPSFVKTAVSNLDETQTVPSIETLTPTPKPTVKPDFQRKNLPSKNEAHTRNSANPNYRITRNLRQQNTTRAKVTTKAILNFNNEFMSRLDITKNEHFSARTMPKQSDNNHPLISLNPNFSKDQAKRQCRLVSRKNTRAKTNIREIQKQIQSRGITISNMLTYRSHQKMSDITISSLLASKLNAPPFDHRKASDNIRFLLTANSFQSYAEDLVCMPY